MRTGGRVDSSDETSSDLQRRRKSSLNRRTAALGPTHRSHCWQLTQPAACDPSGNGQKESLLAGWTARRADATGAPREEIRLRRLRARIYAALSHDHNRKFIQTAVQSRPADRDVLENRVYRCSGSVALR